MHRRDRANGTSTAERPGGDRAGSSRDGRDRRSTGDDQDGRVQDIHPATDTDAR
jgi:hypothetical protein